MVVRLDLGQDVRQFLVPAIGAVRPRREARHAGTREHRGVVRIGDDGTQRMRLVRLADHAEQRFAARLAVDHPGGVENLVAAMLGVGLREHHQLDIGGIAPGLADEQLDQIVDFIVRQRQPEAAVGLDQRRTPAAEQIDRGHRPGREMAKEFGRLRKIAEHGFDHAVVQLRSNDRPLLGGQRAPGQFNAIGDTALDTFDGLQSAIPRDVGGLRRPRRNGSDARRDQEQLATLRAPLCIRCTLLKQRRQLPAIFIAERLAQLGKMPVLGTDDARTGHQGLNA